MYSPDKRSSKYMKKNWNTKEKNKFIHTTIGDFNVFSTPDRTSRKKKKKKPVGYIRLNNTINLT